MLRRRIAGVVAAVGLGVAAALFPSASQADTSWGLMEQPADTSWGFQGQDTSWG